MSTETGDELVARLDRIGESIDALKKENADLRAALRVAIATHGESCRDRGQCAFMVQARAALAKSAPKLEAVAP